MLLGAGQGRGGQGSSTFAVAAFPGMCSAPSRGIALRLSKGWDRSSAQQQLLAKQEWGLQGSKDSARAAFHSSATVQKRLGSGLQRTRLAPNALPDQGLQPGTEQGVGAGQRQQCGGKRLAELDGISQVQGPDHIRLQRISYAPENQKYCRTKTLQPEAEQGQGVRGSLTLRGAMSALMLPISPELSFQGDREPGKTP